MSATEHCGGEECVETRRRKVRVTVGVDDVRDAHCDACGCLCQPCDAATTASGFRAPWRKQLELWGR